MPRRSEGRLVLLCEMRQFQALLRQVLRIHTHTADVTAADLLAVALAIVFAGLFARPVY